MLRQRTIGNAVHAIGVGVHSGEKVRMTLRPAGENTGIVFVRLDRNRARVRAWTLNVADTTLSTTLAQNGIRVATVEHLLSALWGLGVDNLIVELTNEEVPIMDGSAAQFISLIRTVGLIEQAAAKRYIRITRPIDVRQGEASARLQPFHGFSAGYTFVADHPVFNTYPKHADLDFTVCSYVDEVSSARSFGLVDELEQARNMNRCKGSNLGNAVGINDDRVLNESGLRFNDEFVKHKVLDAIGDLYLLGYPILGAFEGYMSGHSLNNKLANTLLRRQDAWELISLDTAAKQQELLVQPAR